LLAHPAQFEQNEQISLFFFLVISSILKSFTCFASVAFQMRM